MLRLAGSGREALTLIGTGRAAASRPLLTGRETLALLRTGRATALIGRSTVLVRSGATPATPRGRLRSAHAGRETLAGVRPTGPGRETLALIRAAHTGRETLALVGVAHTGRETLALVRTAHTRAETLALLRVPRTCPETLALLRAARTRAEALALVGTTRARAEALALVGVAHTGREGLALLRNRRAAPARGSGRATTLGAASATTGFTGTTRLTGGLLAGARFELRADQVGERRVGRDPDALLLAAPPSTRTGLTGHRDAATGATSPLAGRRHTTGLATVLRTPVGGETVLVRRELTVAAPRRRALNDTRGAVRHRTGPAGYRRSTHTLTARYDRRHHGRGSPDRPPVTGSDPARSGNTRHTVPAAGTVARAALHGASSLARTTRHAARTTLTVAGTTRGTLTGATAGGAARGAVRRPVPARTLLARIRSGRVPGTATGRAVQRSGAQSEPVLRLRVRSGRRSRRPAAHRVRTGRVRAVAVVSRGVRGRTGDRARPATAVGAVRRGMCGHTGDRTRPAAAVRRGMCRHTGDRTRPAAAVRRGV
ncbi:hypothetical protein ADL15_43115 [Actinoplanes awajinensis subsp. mycoplanecinus]|uniref:Uncharacterized protein n=1 Tax=Actinoplanes awajinensis subsp. mycoplanecinus TaxID=135947 RepID=A0A101JDE1_9ACTN|nr:hypothetical protein ADL15_43115 [Actinoplanes awajinensis subsp. mycoplanecinus]